MVALISDLEGLSAIASSKRPATASAHARPLCGQLESIAIAREYDSMALGVSPIARYASARLSNGLDVLHDDVGLTFECADLVHRADVRVIELRCLARFVMERPLPVAAASVYDFHRHDSLESRVVGA